MEDQRITEAERQQIEHIRELDFEELQVEEVDEDSSDDHLDANGVASLNEFTFNTCLASLHTYLGEVDDTHNRVAFLDGGAVLNLPLFYLEGVVLFPEATLPLRVIQPNFISVVERALAQVHAPYTIGVIRQYRRLEDGSMNVVTRGQQRFHLKRRWIDIEGVPCGEVQIIQEDLPLRIPRDACGKVPPSSKLHGRGPLCRLPLNATSHSHGDGDNDSEANSEESFENELSLAERRIHKSAFDPCYGYDPMDESTSSDDDKSACQSEIRSRCSPQSDSNSVESLHLYDNKEIKHAAVEIGNSSGSARPSWRGDGLRRSWRKTDLTQFHSVTRAFWPYWVYRMYDSYCLAQKTADMWKQIVGTPSMDALVKKPDLLSFYIASKIPVSESTRQELLEIDGISYRLQREIELLKNFDLIRCRTCQTVIAKRSDMLVMSTDGPLGAYVNPNGYVHEIMTLYRANGLALWGHPQTEYSWFPGYAWTITNCATCETQMGWLFTATKKNLKPKSFWGIQSAQVADGVH
ncbi:uncharacterized protein LOC119996613 isoform X2 [Tripterygium wilfordii]|uniref:uncharacterized protein LOC119996613 isoform X2 n=1 Tax=Tripterygium wilfordii TaxID=458696 RepID=UPI0018F80D4B|nr:uncharacterized protein LOC119996613 isoform X2 [Tripterygium wilfordii]